MHSGYGTHTLLILQKNVLTHALITITHVKFCLVPNKQMEKEDNKKR